MALRVQQPFEFQTVGSVLADIFGNLEQEVSAGQQFDGTPGKGRFEFDGHQGHKFVKLAMEKGGEAATISFDMVDDKGRRFPLYTEAAVTDTKIVILGSVILEPWEHLELVTTGATAAMYAKVDTKR